MQKVLLPYFFFWILISSHLAWGACEYVENGYGSVGRTPVRLEPVVTGLEVPWGIGFLPNGDYLVTERPGRIRIVKNGVLASTPVAQVQTAELGEGGLLGIAIHPDFSSNRFFYVYYTAQKGSQSVNRVERFRLSDASDVSDDTDNSDNSDENEQIAQSDRIILDDIPASVRHDGGRIRFGPDGNLYIATGDSGNPSLAQDQNSLAGKVLRLTPEGDVPDDNPWPGNPAYILGVRNVQGLDWFNSDTLIVTDHGPSGDLGRFGNDELNVAKKGDNLGWPDLWQCEEREGYVAPVLVWQDALPPGGLSLVKGGEVSSWDGSLLIGSLGSEHLQRVVLDSGSASQVQVNEVYFDEQNGLYYGRLREVIQAPNGEIYVTTSNCDGRGVCPSDGDHILKLKAVP